jgi:hypothetical protein
MDYWIVGVAIVLMSYCIFVMISMHQSAKEIEAIFKEYDEGIRQIIELQMEILEKRNDINAL